MSNLFKDLESIDSLIRDLVKIESKLINGQEVLAYRDLMRVLSTLKKHREEIIAESVSNEK